MSNPQQTARNATLRVASVSFTSSDNSLSSDNNNNSQGRSTSTANVVTQDLDEVLRRFCVRDEKCCGSGPFNGDTFKRKSQEYIKEHGLAEKHWVLLGGNVQGNAPTQLVIQTAATFKENYFFQGPVSGRTFSVASAAMAEEMKRRNFIEVQVDHFTDPTKCPEAEAPEGDSNVDVLMAPVPSQLKLPNFSALGGKLPKLYQANSDEKYSAQLVRAWGKNVSYTMMSCIRLQALDQRSHGSERLQ